MASRRASRHPQGPQKVPRDRPQPTPVWARRRGPAATRSKRDWITIGAIALAGLPGLAALVALVFTYQQVNATNAQLQIAEQGQITDRYNAAITNLGSPSIEVRLGGIYALQRLMQDSPRDQSTVIAVLCAFVRDQTSSAATPKQSAASQLPTDIQAALTVVGTRNTANGGTVDFDHTQLPDAQLSSLKLFRANFFNANLDGADLIGADLARADLFAATLTGATLTGATLTGANLDGATLDNVDFIRATLNGATFPGADLSGANLTGANLTGADLRGAILGGANFNNAEWSSDVPPPEGWIRDSASGRLRHASASA
jgi:uncharacterized protein YjbI with pentapeptide repeats